MLLRSSNFAEEVGAIQAEAVDGNFEDRHLHSVVVLERRDNLSHLQNEFRTHEVERRGKGRRYSSQLK
jgi:hypothetical protein